MEKRREGAMTLFAAKFSIHTRATSPISLPPYKGSTLRGAFGAAFRRICCMLSNTDCRICAARAACAYLYVFETPPPEGVQMIPPNASAPHPFVIEPPLGDRTSLEPGEDFHFDLVLIGRGINYLPYFVCSFKEMGNRGIGRGRGQFDVTTVGGREIDGSEKTVYDSLHGSFVDSYSVIGMDDAANENCDRITVEFLTPTRIQQDGKLQDSLPFDLLLKNLLRRIALLSLFHGENSRADFDHRVLIDGAKTIAVTSQDLCWHDWERYSSRQDTRMKLGGLLGSITYSGDLSPFWKYLKFGELIHVGKGTTFGLGKYQLKIDR